jgi:hypothetical protein
VGQMPVLTREVLMNEPDFQLHAPNTGLGCDKTRTKRH